MKLWKYCIKLMKAKIEVWEDFITAMCNNSIKITKPIKQNSLNLK